MNCSFYCRHRRALRWTLCLALVPTLWACNTHKLGDPVGTPSQVVQTKILLSQNRQLDLLFMVDDSSSMDPLQKKLAARLPDFMQTLSSLRGGLPDLHVAVISSSLGAGAFACNGGLPSGDQAGRFQHKPGCGLLDGETFIKASADGKANNFTGDIEKVFGCIAQLGSAGCGFEHQLESTRTALIKAFSASDPDNGGFLRDGAQLGVVMLTNEDDCSVPADSELFDPGVESLADNPPLGGLWSYRCNEFGHRCDQPLPHTAAGLPRTLTGCVSKENADGKYHLTPVKDFVTFLKSQLPDSHAPSAPPKGDKVFVAVIGGPADPYVVKTRVASLSRGGTEMQPEIGHSCTAPEPGAPDTYADPGIRLRQFVFDIGGVFLPICADSFKPALEQIASELLSRLPTPCLRGHLAEKVDGVPDCVVSLRVHGSGDTFADTPLAACAPGNANAASDKPCWRLEADAGACAAEDHVLRFCHDAACAPVQPPTARTEALVSCALVL